MFFWKIRPSFRRNPSSPATRACSSVQIRSSDQAFTSSAGSHWKYMRCTSGVRLLISAKPRSACRA